MVDKIYKVYYFYIHKLNYCSIKIIMPMLYYLIGTVAILLTIVCIASAFSGHFPTFDFDDKFSQTVCRMFVVISGVLLAVTACAYPDIIFGEAFFESPIGLQILFTLLSIVCFMIVGFVYYVVNVICIIFISSILLLIKRIFRPISCAD